MNPIDPNVPVLSPDLMRQTILQLDDPNDILNACNSVPAYICNDLFWLNTIIRVFGITEPNVVKYNDANLPFPRTTYRQYFNTLVNSQNVVNVFMPDLARNILMEVDALTLVRSYQLPDVAAVLTDNFWRNKLVRDTGMIVAAINAARGALTYRQYYYGLAGLPL